MKNDCVRRLVMGAMTVVIVGYFVYGCGGSSGGGEAGPPSGDGGLGGGGGAASICGDPGTPCCDGNTCSSGGCCVAGICMAVGGSCVGLGSGLCSNGACGNCGGPGLPCCTTSAGASSCTAPNTRCSGGTCVACGVLGSPCCAPANGGTGICNAAGAICSSDVCIACGTPGSACCPGNQCGSPGCCYNSLCVGESTACGSNGGVCQAGRCSGCGGKNQPCCSNLCYDGLLCRSGTCSSCGAAGEVCCPASGSAPACQAGNACSGSGDGVCARCGGLGDICCPGNACSEGCCSGGRCLASGECSPDASIGSGGAGGVRGSGGVTSSGGSKASGGSSGSGGCGALIDDMESGTGYICSSRKGAWYTYVDSLSSSSITPAPLTYALPETLSTPRASSSSRAMHISGTYTTYAGLACWLNNTSFEAFPGTYNGSSYTGIRFYAKGTGSLIVVGQMPSTEMVKYGGSCPDTADCAGNQYSVGTLSTDWKQYQVPFTYLTDGYAEPFDPRYIWSLEFMFYSYASTSTKFDLWVDDLTFY